MEHPAPARVAPFRTRSMDDLDKLERQLQWLSPEVAAQGNQLGLAVLGAASDTLFHTGSTPNFLAQRLDKCLVCPIRLMWARGARLYA